jgi:hypothetical protein
MNHFLRVLIFWGKRQLVEKWCPKTFLKRFGECACQNKAGRKVLWADDRESLKSKLDHIRISRSDQLTLLSQVRTTPLRNWDLSAMELLATVDHSSAITCSLLTTINYHSSRGSPSIFNFAQLKRFHLILFGFRSPTLRSEYAILPNQTYHEWPARYPIEHDHLQDLNASDFYSAVEIRFGQILGQNSRRLNWTLV